MPAMSDVVCLPENSSGGRRRIHAGPAAGVSGPTWSQNLPPAGWSSLSPAWPRGLWVLATAPRRQTSSTRSSPRSALESFINWSKIHESTPRGTASAACLPKTRQPANDADRSRWQDSGGHPAILCTSLQIKHIRVINLLAVLCFPAENWTVKCVMQTYITHEVTSSWTLFHTSLQMSRGTTKYRLTAPFARAPLHYNSAEWPTLLLYILYQCFFHDKLMWLLQT